MSDTRDYILKTSLVLFLQKSYRDVTMKEIVEKTGLSKGAFYHYFTSKEELFKEIVFGFFAEGKMDYDSFPNDSLVGFYKQVVQHMNAFFTQLDKVLGINEKEKSSINFLIILFEAVARFPEFLELERKQHMYDIKAWSAAIKRAREQNEIHSESTDEQLARLFLYCTDGTFVRFVNSEKKISYSDLLEEAFETVYMGIKK